MCLCRPVACHLPILSTLAHSICPACRADSSDLFEFLRANSGLYELSSPGPGQQGQHGSFRSGPSGGGGGGGGGDKRRMLGGLSRAVADSTHSVGRGLSSASGAVAGTVKQVRAAQAPCPVRPTLSCPAGLAGMRPVARLAWLPEALDTSLHQCLHMQGVSELASAASGGVSLVAGGVTGAAGAVIGALTGPEPERPGGYCHQLPAVSAVTVTACLRGAHLPCIIFFQGKILHAAAASAPLGLARCSSGPDAAHQERALCAGPCWHR